MRTTLILDDELIQRAKHAAVDRNQTLSEFVNRALSSTLAQVEAREVTQERFSMITFGEVAPPVRHEPADFAAESEEDDLRSLAGE